VILGVDERSAEGRWVFGCVQQAGVGNVRLLPRVPVGSVAAYLYAADCLLVPPTSAPLERFGRTVLPMKLFPYMASGTPILAPKLPDIEEVLEHDRTSVLVPPNDPEAAAQGLRHLLEDRARAERLGVAAEEESRKYTWAARARTIAAALERWHR
jgi:glycosyltransferase involved in cell wall biosynthesis